MSDYYAFSSIDTAIDRTKSLLWPFKKGIWLRIALISLFTGGFFSFNPFTTGTENFPFQATTGANTFMDHLPVILAIVAAIIIFALIIAYISSVFQFLFVDCLSSKEFAIRKYFKSNLGRGARLFGFQIAMGVILVLIIIAAVVSLFAGVVTELSFTSLTAIIMFFLALFLICIPFMIIMLFTIDFVVPIMLKDKCGVIDGWKRCWTIMKSGWGQTIVYLIMRVILAVIVSILMLIAIMIAAVVLAIPFFVIALFTIGFSSEFFATSALITLLIIFIICLIPVALLISVPFVTFIRYYSLNTLGCMDENYRMTE
ncbi:hypothetical protein J2128_000819 [Methanomicrobium sp. W14]|uniref:DUF7544 domain-containing protein n=1 Tax=Methanomicrobium sp. W14 TaxID=2817839 RepID=UPI001AE6AA51|nr:hypothetical protein [Methanomicrobium sp. W14]MBP2132898.1 hypothetical protein [Methanomicrobium sp. W14]